MLPESDPGARYRGMETWFHPGSNVSVSPGTAVGVTVGLVVGSVVGPVVGTVVTVVWGEVVGAVVSVVVGMRVVAVVTGDVVGVVVTGLVDVGVGVGPAKVRARFCEVPDWKYAVCAACEASFSQNVIRTGPAAISSFVA